MMASGTLGRFGTMVVPLVLIAGCVSITPVPSPADGSAAPVVAATVRPPSSEVASIVPSAGPSASRAPAQSPADEGVLLREDFSKEGTWSRIVGDFGAARIVDGVYRMRSGPDGGYMYGTPNSGPFYDDTTVEATVTLVDTAATAYAAILCRGVDDFRWYELGISTDGVAYIGALSGDDYEVVASQDIDPPAAGEPVRLAATCRESRQVELSLAVDGRTVAEATVADGLTLGFIGLTVGGDAAATFEWDDLVIRRP